MLIEIPKCLGLNYDFQFKKSLVQICFFFFLRFYLFIHERHTQREGERQRHRQREKQAPCREPDVGLDPGSPGSHPGLQAALNHCATGAALGHRI